MLSYLLSIEMMEIFTDPELSIVIPIRDESCALVKLYQEIERVIESLKMKCEILFIDDHSTDNTHKIISKLVLNSMCTIRYIFLELHQGKDRALERGFKEAKGEIIITLDGDGQNDPADIPQMLEALGDNDVVCGVRHHRHDPVIKKLVSVIANQVRKFITKDTLVDAGCAIRVMRSKCTEYLYPIIPELFDTAHYFFPAILKKRGCKVIQVEVNHRKRITGKSKFRLFHGRVISGVRACFLIRKLKRILPEE